MSTMNVKPDDVRRQAEQDDPFRLGWRYVNKVGPDGKVESVQVPLTEEDVLHPQEDDFIVQDYAHDRDCDYLRDNLRALAQTLPGMKVFCDHRFDWGVEGVKAHGPDICVIVGFFGEWDPRRGTFHPKEFGAQPALVVEVTSASTRTGDLTTKVTEYHQAGIPLYVIVDGLAGESKPRLIGYRHAPGGYERIPLDDLGRLWLEPVRLWLAWEDDRVVLLDERGNPRPDFVELGVQAREAEQRAADAEQQADLAEQARRDAEQARLDAERRTTDAERRAADEARRAADLAARLKELEDRLNALGGGGTPAG
jgi:Uma2 family endonuclease